MKRRPILRLAVVLALLAIPIALAVVSRQPDFGVNPEAAIQVWSELLRDADSAGTRIVRASAREESALGEKIGRAVLASSREDARDSRYVAEVGQDLANRATRGGIKYQFHVVESPEVNSFAIPGGWIFVNSAMLDFVRSEAELAYVLGHEISHIDLRHCADRFHYEIALKRAGAGGVGEAIDLARLPFIVGYTNEQESDADAQAVRLALEAGYDPRAALMVTDRLAAQYPERHATGGAGPAGEAAAVAVGALDEYFRSHPRSRDRGTALQNLTIGYRRKLGGLTVYEGEQNLKKRIPKSSEMFPGETTTLLTPLSEPSPGIQPTSSSSPTRAPK